jgi:hypothetical protein
MHTVFGWEYHEEDDHQKDIDVGGGIILTRILERGGMD